MTERAPWFAAPLCRLGFHRWPKVCARSMFVLKDCVRGCGATTVSRPEQWWPIRRSANSQAGSE